MAASRRELTTAAFARLREQVATAAALCSELQMITLADHIHDAIRRLRYAAYDSVEIDVIPPRRHNLHS
ncbi:MAG: hypothetical protein JWM33_1883 [Caulobacteraceae bacterium]|nr:hypothetical protein [Caulobacteraceae bacterium]